MNTAGLTQQTRLGATHISTNTKLRAISSNAKSSFGLVGVPVVVIDEPGALEILGGQMLSDSLFTAQGKVGSRLKLILCGTLGPMATGAGHWWWDLVKDGTKGRTYVKLYQGELETWDQWATIRKANPLIGLDAHTRKVILEERDEARGDTRLRARFCTYRLNRPSLDESQVLLTTQDWERIVARDTPERQGRPIVGVDLGGGRAWSAAVALYPNGRVECKAVAPGIPDLEAQEVRDRVPSGTYSRLFDLGQLDIAEGLRVQKPEQLWDMIRACWGRPELIVLDRFRLPEFQDAVGNRVRLEPRVTRWSEAAFDIRSLRALALDGGLAVDLDSQALLATSLSSAIIKADESGSFRLVKKGTNNTARDDCASALLLAAGALARKSEPPSIRSLGLAG